MQLRLPPQQLLISYAQNFEDVLLHRVFSQLESGFYVDVGAFDPSFGSVTKVFYDRGWSGINIEPGSVFERLRAARPRDINLNIAILDRRGEVNFVENEADRATSYVELSADADKQGGARTYSVACDRLDNVLAEHAAGRLINFMKIDAEGSETSILQSTDWTKIRPQILVIEAVAPWTNELVSQPWEGSLLSSGYKRAYFDGVNLFFVRDEDADLLRHFDRPVNVLDWFVKYDSSDLAFAASYFASVSGGSTRSLAGADGITLFKCLREVALQLEAVSPQRRGLANGTQAGTDVKHISPSSAPAPLEAETLLPQLRAAMSFAARADRVFDQVDRVLEKRRDVGLGAAGGEPGAGRVVAPQPEQLLHEVEAAVAAAARYDRVARELRDPGGPRALRLVLPLGRAFRTVRDVAVGPRAVTPVGLPLPHEGAIGRQLRVVLAKPRSVLRRVVSVLRRVVSVLRRIVSRLVAPFARRAREFLLEPLRPMVGQLDAMTRDLEVIRRELGRIEGVSPELVKSIEAVLLTTSVSRSSR